MKKKELQEFVQVSIAPDKLRIELSKHRGYYEMKYAEHIPSIHSGKFWENQVRLIREKMPNAQINGHWLSYTEKRNEILAILMIIMTEVTALMKGRGNKNNINMESLLDDMVGFTKFLNNEVKKVIIDNRGKKDVRNRK